MVRVSDDLGGFLLPLDLIPVLLQAPPEASPLTPEEMRRLRDDFAALYQGLQRGKAQVLDSTVQYLPEPDDDSDDGDTPIIVEE